MIIDDSSYNLFVMEELVHQIDPHIEIDTALNGQIALNKIKKSLPRQGPLYDVIFTDIHMPVLDGYEVSKKLTSVTLLSSLDSQRSQVTAF